MSTMRDKVVLITGGTSGIGRAAASAFARAGARIVLAARRRDLGEKAVETLRQEGADVRYLETDVSRVEEVDRLVASVAEIHGRLDAAFNTAPTTDGAMALTADFTEEQFDRALAMNLKSVWLCMRAEIRQMLAQSPAGGAIVNTSSVNGLGGAPGGGLYSAAKAGVLALTKSAAQEYATRGIRVNGLVAGAFRTPMLEHVFETAGGGTPEGSAAVEAQYNGFIPMRRIGTPGEAAEAAVWLCSEAASYVTGHSLIVDGGMTSAVR
jgi:NAD(P)-dependent dehydrogenase (short-subunit alcohol dehydrogenase family)